MSARHFILFVVLLFSLSTINGQTHASGQAFISSKFKPYILTLTHERRALNSKLAFPFREIEVADYRADTSRIGFSFDRTTGHRELLLIPGMASAVKSFFNNSFANPAASHSLLVVIRKFSISEITPEEPEQAFTGKPHTTQIRFRAETYLKVDTAYVAFGYLDTTITSSKHILQIMPFRLPELLTAFMQKMSALDTDKFIKTRKRVSYAFIDSFSNRKFSYPMNKAVALQKGVYANLDDFKNNRPTIHDYAVESEGETFSLLLKDKDGKMYFTRKIWGYCDGQQSFFMINGNLFPILRENNAYYVFGSRDYIIKTTRIPIFLLIPAAGFVAGSVPISQKVIMKLRMFTLDPETGEID